MAVFLDELVTQYGMKKENLKILDVAAGTGLVGEELKKRGFNIKNVDALDLCPDMLNVARKKNVYGKLVQAPFGSTMPKGMTARSYDCVIMCGGFAAGHIPLSRFVLDHKASFFINNLFFFHSLHTMARLCKEGGFIINSMTKQYADVCKLYLNEEVISSISFSLLRNIRILTDILRNLRKKTPGKSCSEGSFKITQRETKDWFME